MAKGRDGMTRPNTAIFILLIMGFPSAGAAQSVDPVEELKACARVTDQNARFACFDKLGERVLREEPTNIEPTREEIAQPEAVTGTAINAQPLPDDLGYTKEIEFSGLITSCKQSSSGTWYFTFDNGQVWKEANQRERRFKECNFDVTIKKDVFGYKMRIHELETSVRVRRHQ